MLRMQNVIYERGSAAHQTAAGARAGAGLGRRARSGAGCLQEGSCFFSQTKVDGNQRGFSQIVGCVF